MFSNCSPSELLRRMGSFNELLSFKMRSSKANHYLNVTISYDFDTKKYDVVLRVCGKFPKFYDGIYNLSTLYDVYSRLAHYDDV